MNRLSYILMSILFTPVDRNRDLLVCYASQTGTAANLARQTGDLVRRKGRAVQVSSLSKLSPEDLDEYQQVLMIVSTCGDGEFPDDGRVFYQQLCQYPQLTVPVHLLALGDKSYPKFCLAGKLVHEQLLRLGAASECEARLVSGNPMLEWKAWLEQYLELEVTENEVTNISRKVSLELLEKRALHNEHSAKSANQAFHIDLRINSDVNITYAVNDLIAIKPPNETKERLYSIASSSLPNSNRLSLCVARHQFMLNGQKMAGACSSFLIDKLQVGDVFEAHIKSGSGMPLPRNEATVIMIATGAGIAPMMSQLEERSWLGHTGDNWVLFGNRYQQDDYYYQPLLEEYLRQGTITRLDCAFSRDDDEKIYVQHRLTQKQDLLIDWILNKKAQIYVCGRPALKQEILAVIERALINNSPNHGAEQFKSFVESDRIYFELF